MKFERFNSLKIQAQITLLMAVSIGLSIKRHPSPRDLEIAMTEGIIDGLLLVGTLSEVPVDEGRIDVKDAFVQSLVSMIPEDAYIPDVEEATKRFKDISDKVNKLVSASDKLRKG
jgi:hypothetical protein